MPVLGRYLKTKRYVTCFLLPRLLTFVLVILASSLGTGLHAQDIRIRVVDGRNGRSIPNQCVNVWVGKTVGALLIPTDKDGIALLHMTDKDTETNIKGRGVACGGWGTIEPTVKYADTISIIGGSHVSCQAPPPDSPLLSFSMEQVLRFGAVTANVCGWVEASPKPGELIFFVRPMHWWEKLGR